MPTQLHQDSEKRYQCILDNIEETYMEIDLDGKITFFNQALSRLLGYSEAELPGMGIENITDGRTAEKVGKVLNTVRNNGTPIAFYDFEIIRKDGGRRWFETSISPIRDANGEAAGFRGIGRDITARKHREEDLLRSLKLESVGILAGGIAHDFNNLLSILLGYISIAQTMVNPDDETAQILKKAEKAAFQATELTKRLITFSRGDDPWRKMTYLEPLLKRTMDFSLVGSGVRFSFSVPDELWPVNIDEGQIRQVARNLVKNAAEAMPGGGIITISAENLNVWEDSGLPLPEGTYVKWSVADQGIGIPAENLPRVFDPYFTTKDMGATKGMGLGLAICYSIIRKHDGSISVEPNKGGGTVFHVYLPAFPVDSRFTEAQKDGPSNGKHRILVMDDEEDILVMIGKLLPRLGYEAIPARGGSEAVDLYRDALSSSAPFSAVMLDLTVKDGLGGKLAMKKLLQIDPGVKGIVMTSYADDPIVANYRYHGFQGALVKPFSLREIRELLEKTVSAGQ